ncbi:gas vesicle protein G [Isosphaera pallida ATCC 43644]|uniref:Gas vesicle protein G n=1 Tax=Isosphaera pallida (strain ATCC 43644 / DSM 9630 / IS1B) TaxID=575540 RepID=E8R1T4_ISOPI|nr:gas vesicle protein GvpG [Isosphaera pallida]ADV61356.1 gas vesicle protein G [Isosphaera pallida ATCC 43644]
MFLVDDILLAPAHSLMFLLREIHQAALEELRRDAQKVREELAECYRALETGALTDEEFASLETDLLDRLDALEELARFNSDEDDDPEDEDWDVEDDDPAEAVW